MKLSTEEIRNLAALARLRENEVKRVEDDLEAILEYVSQIQSVGTKSDSGLKPGGFSRLRPDEVSNPATPERRAELTERENGEIRVPGVFAESGDV